MPYLEMRNITKRFTGVVANDDVTLTVERGEIHGLVGENGAGKSTLMRVLYGMHAPDSGRILLDGDEVTIPTPQAAIALGIGMVHQNFQLVPSLTVGQNVALGQEPRRGLFVDTARINRQVRDLSEHFGLAVDPEALVSDLSIGVQQRVEILKLLYRRARLLILDEPTAVLTPQEVVALFDVLTKLTEEGYTIIFITHKLDEVMAVCRHATVLRHGKVTGTVDVAASSSAELARLMVGRDVDDVVRQPKRDFGPDVLVLRDVYALDDRGMPALRDLSFSVRQGEIVGLAGVEGNGQRELIEVLAGLRTSRGQIDLAGTPIATLSPRRRREAGLGLIPEDHHRQGLNPETTIAENLVATRYFKAPFARFGVLDRGAIEERAGDLIERFDVRAEGVRTPVKTLSGGNAQKVVVARELTARPAALVAAHPTRGLDVGAAQFVRTELLRMRDEGVAVLLVSADLNEILALSDRILVIYEGQIAGEFAPDEVTSEDLGLVMAGHTADGRSDETRVEQHDSD